MRNLYIFRTEHCHHCLCEVCTRHKCLRHDYGPFWLYCAHMQVGGYCPTVKCDFFENCFKKKVYRVKRRSQKVEKRDIILEQLDRIEKMLDKIGEK